MIKKMAHIVDGKVVNVSLWDGQNAWTPAEEVVEITGVAGIGWDYVDGEFVDNRPVLVSEPEPPTEQELARQSAVEKLKKLGLTEEEALALVGG